MHEEETFFGRANHVRLGAGIDRRDDRGDLSQACRVATDVLSVEETVWRDGDRDPTKGPPFMSTARCYGLDPKSGPLSGGEILVHGNLVPLT